MNIFFAIILSLYLSLYCSSSVEPDSVSLHAYLLEYVITQCGKHTRGAQVIHLFIKNNFYWKPILLGTMLSTGETYMKKKQSPSNNTVVKVQSNTALTESDPPPLLLFTVNSSVSLDTLVNFSDSVPSPAKSGVKITILHVCCED